MVGENNDNLGLFLRMDNDIINVIVMTWTGAGVLRINYSDEIRQVQCQ